MHTARVTAAIPIVIAAAAIGLVTPAVSQAMSCEHPINGTFTATSDGRWSKTREVYRDQAVVVATWTVRSECDDDINCTGTVSSQQGWSAELRCRSGHWLTEHRVENWHTCPDGTTIHGDQSFRFWRTADQPETFEGYDRTIGPSGGCGTNLWLTVEMPLVLTAA